MDIQSNLRIAIYTNDVKKIDTLLQLEKADFFTVQFSIDRTKKLPCLKNRDILSTILSSCVLSANDKQEIIQRHVNGGFSDITNIIESYVS